LPEFIIYNHHNRCKGQDSHQTSPSSHNIDRPTVITKIEQQPRLPAAQTARPSTRPLRSNAHIPTYQAPKQRPLPTATQHSQAQVRQQSQTITPRNRDGQPDPITPSTDHRGHPPGRGRESSSLQSPHPGKCTNLRLHVRVVRSLLHHLNSPTTPVSTNHTTRSPKHRK
jgi:hypothetical protein